MAGLTVLTLPPASPDAAEVGGETPRAAPGYVPDRACAPCHRQLYESYKEVGMSRSFYRPSRERVIEDYENNHFYHPPSQRHYQMLERDGRFFLRRYRQGPDGEERDVLEREIHWILGSGSHSRTYLHQSEWGELYQLPIAWYTEIAAWGMAPGYDHAGHKGFNRRVQRDCMFCHNAYPDVPAGSDRYGEPQIFPSSLPEGIGCQRCHGPGAEHARLAFDPEVPAELVRASIVHPGKLAPELRDDICYGCHLQPSVTLSGVRRLGRPIYSFRPGQALANYLVLMDVVEDRPASRRFEINHHPYRLRQSACYRKSEGALSCLTCHDPHRKRRGEEAVAHYRAACLSCHAVEDCDLEAMSGDRPAVGDDCAGCHMPRRRTEDVVQVTMTDHKIRRRPGGAELTAPMKEREVRLETVELLEPETGPKGREALLYRTLAMVRSGSGAALDRLRSALRAAPDEISPHLELAVGLLAAGRFAEVEDLLTPWTLRAGDRVLPHLHLGVALAAQGRSEDALGHLERAVALAPERPEGRYNLGRLLAQMGRSEEAIVHFEAALAARPSLGLAWFELGNAHARGGRPGSGRPVATIEPYRRALANDPDLGPARQNLIASLERLGRRDEALAELRAWIFFEPDNERARRQLVALTGKE